MKIDDINLHDALLKSMRVDYAEKTISIEVAFYADARSSDRVDAIIDFKKVESISQITDFTRLKDNAFAGNIHYWIPEKIEGTTFIYLMDGCISIKAARMSFKKVKSNA